MLRGHSKREYRCRASGKAHFRTWKILVSQFLADAIKTLAMQTSGSVSLILANKGAQVWSVAPETTVFEAIQLMAEKNIGALIVLDGDKLEGMLTERDYTRKVALKGKSSRQTKVAEILTKPVVSVTPGHTVEDCMRLMTEHRVRHLPVVDGEKVSGIISIGDLVNWTISTQTAAIEQLERYILGH